MNQPSAPTSPAPVNPDPAPRRVGILTLESQASGAAVKRLLAALGDQIKFVGLSDIYRPGGGGTLKGTYRHFRRGGWRWMQFLFHNFTLPLWRAGLLGWFWPRFRSIRQTCTARRVPVLKIAEARSAAFLAGREQRIDVLVCLYFDQILQAPALAALQQAGVPVINVHVACLPDHRGPMPVFYSLLDQPPVLGCTLHQIQSADIDEGPVFDARTVAPIAGEHVLAANRRLHLIGAEMLLTLLQQALPPACAQTAGGRYEGFPDKAALRAARKRGVRLV